MNPILNEASFQAITAAAAAAAASATNANAAAQETNEGGLCQKMSDMKVTAAPSETTSEEWDMQRSSADTDDDVQQNEWTNITDEFFAACNELNMGELAQDMLFGLFEAMSAIEIMDPKMDVGMNYNKNAQAPLTFESALESGVLKVENLTPEEYIGIFDSIFACIVSWLDGNNIDQGLFTCIYLHSTADIKDKALQAFCVAVRQLIVIIKNIISDSTVNEEEDVQLFSNSSFLTLEDSQAANVVPQLKAAADALLAQSKNSSQNDDIMSVVHRLRFMRCFYHSIYQFDVAISNASTESIMNDIHKNLTASQELVPLIKRTIDKGTQPAADSDAPNPMGFSPRINDRSQPPTFPRIVKIRDRASSMQFFEELVQRLKYACKVVRMRDYYTVLNFFTEFSRKSGQCILSRCVLQGLFCVHRRLVFGSIPIRDFLWESVRQFSNSQVLYPKHALGMNPKIQMYLESFFRFCININTFTQFIRICGYNRARQREKLARFIESLDSIQVEAARLDSNLTMMCPDLSAEGKESEAYALKHSATYATWVLYNCFRAIYLYIMSGFELELYSVHEYMYIYWYPYEVLLSFLISALSRTESALGALEDYADMFGKSQSGGASGSSKNRKQKQKKNKRQQKPYRQEIIFYHALVGMCGGYYKGMAALTKDGRIRQPLPQFNSEEIRFNHRFAPLHALTSPPPVAYKDYQSISSVLLKSPSTEIYESAAKHFDQARSMLESLNNPDQEVLDMIQVAKVNVVVMNVLSKGHQRNLKKQPEFNFEKHRHFPIIKLNN